VHVSKFIHLHTFCSTSKVIKCFSIFLSLIILSMYFSTISETQKALRLVSEVILPSLFDDSSAAHILIRIKKLCCLHFAYSPWVFCCETSWLVECNNRVNLIVIQLMQNTISSLKFKLWPSVMLQGIVNLMHLMYKKKYVPRQHANDSN
jgi:hypothetical protein